MQVSWPEFVWEWLRVVGDRKLLALQTKLVAGAAGSAPPDAPPRSDQAWQWSETGKEGKRVPTGTAYVSQLLSLSLSIH